MIVLINPVSGWWNVHFIDSHFYPPDAKLIKSLPLCSTPQPDILIWPKEKYGNYSVKSGYKLLYGMEDVLHSLWSCDKLKAVWEKDFGWAVRSGNSLNSFSKLLKLIQSKPHSVALFAATAWSVWYHKNKTRLNETTLPLEKITDFARDYIRDFNNLIKIPPCSRYAVQRRWCPPVPDYWKVNFHGIGVVIRNSNGKVRAALSEKIKKPPTVEILELLAAKRAVLFSLETAGRELKGVT
uniref:RNase H type-1 domain-containing protein n=1 Tax=Quercus lobata TaxID=97700 RepID=A0A7N2L779_QUELO